ncbi:MAG: TonB-dependent receptor plug domain-containing protein [Candidatus Eisenbacteria bacterium]|nr:TonB-dependent receptor plug domain-containing protein [Candidatus Latescibacterota bacterium]MBD3300989.1 TonB-dependent receptor plug domain-containing protein [Candidatus Eisenbacteria bacterium]
MKRTIPILLSLLLGRLLGGEALALPLEVQVENAETARPIQGATVRLLETGASRSTDQHGRTRFAALPDGRHRLVASRVGFEPSDTLLVTVGSGGGAIAIRLRPKPWVLDEVVVTGTRSPHMLKEVPVQTEVVGRREFRKTGATSVDEALAWSTGINVREDLSGQGVSLRGLDENRVLILVDGERAVGRVRGSIDLSQYSLTNVDRIEVVKGTGSTLYGSEAIGGVVNIITKRPEEEPAGGST